jgi:hypothetical protein
MVVDLGWCLFEGTWLCCTTHYFPFAPVFCPVAWHPPLKERELRDGASRALAYIDAANVGWSRAKGDEEVGEAGFGSHEGLDSPGVFFPTDTDLDWFP